MKLKKSRHKVRLAAPLIVNRTPHDAGEEIWLAAYQIERLREQGREDQIIRPPKRATERSAQADEEV
jgi:hypothetical protein